MGNREEENEVRQEELCNEVTLLINVLAEISPILSDEGISVGRGLIIFSETANISQKIQRIYKAAGAVAWKNIVNARQKTPNNRIGMHLHQKYDAVKQELEFLALEGFTPIVAAHTVLPEHLKEEALVIYEAVPDSEETILEELRSFRQHIHEEPSVIRKYLSLAETSEAFPQWETHGALSFALEIVAEVFCHSYRNTHNEAETKRKRNLFHAAIMYRKQLLQRYSGSWDISGAVKRALEKFVFSNPQILLGRVDGIEGKIFESIQNNAAVLYDEDFYYFPEKIFKAACSPLLDMVAISNIKSEMAANGDLCSNRIADGNYTVKKLLTNVYGSTLRARFLKIRRGFFDKDGELGLYERRETYVCRNV